MFSTKEFAFFLSAGIGGIALAMAILYAVGAIA